MISSELQSLLLASNRQSWCSVSRPFNHLLKVHRCCNSGLARAQLVHRLRAPLPPSLASAASSKPLWQSCDQLFQTEPLSGMTVSQQTDRTQPLPPLSFLAAAASPPPPQPEPKPNDRRSRQDQEDREAIERLKKEVKRLQDRTAITYKNPCKATPNYTKTATIDQLNAVKYHMEEFIPRFFVSLMDYSVFTPDLVYINEMQTPAKVSKGVYLLSVDRLKLKLYYDVRYAMKKPVILRIDTDRANSCLAIRLRVRCIGGSKPFTHLTKMNQLGTAAYIEQNGEWHDYLIYAHVTNDARVWQLRVTNLTEDRNPSEAPVRLSIVQRLRQLLRRRAPLPTPSPA